MLQVTETAGAHLAKLLDQQDAPPDVAVRFVQANQGISFQPDTERPGDEKFEHEGRTVLLLDAAAAELLASETLHSEGGKLELTPPKKGE